MTQEIRALLEKAASLACSHKDFALCEEIRRALADS